MNESEEVHWTTSESTLPAEVAKTGQISAELEAGGSLERLPEELLSMIARTWGISPLRELQDRAMRSILADEDLLLVLPTGGGKSLCYQAPAVYREGLTLVVSPLISLMKDQVDGLRQNGVAASMMTSAQSAVELRDVHADLDHGLLKLLFVSPERLGAPGFFGRLRSLGLRSIAIDEAHCISHWGHDFRPEYRQLGEFRRMAPDLSVHAFTATATESVRNDIVEQLGLNTPRLLVGDCDRPNLCYRAVPRANLESQILETINKHPGQAGIVYCITRRDVERIDAQLRRAGLRSAAYHAGLSPNKRARVQEQFQAEDLDVVVATVAFGMGIDRTDVRFVIHAALPKGVEQYSQEVGRAGRDGLPSECVLFYSGADYHSWKGLIERGAREAEHSGQFCDPEATVSAIDRLGQMMNFTTRFVCRHKQLVEHFSQEYRGPTEGCGACDVCKGEIDLTDDSQVVAQKILSAIVRCDQRYGAAHITDVLRGAKTAGLKRTGHDSLSVYGLLSEHSQTQVRSWIDQLSAAGHILVTPGRYPTLYLSQSGVQVMKAELELSLFSLPKQIVAKKRRTPVALNEPEPGAPPTDEDLFESLRALRKELAAERGVPPYLIFNDRTLLAFASHKPKTMAEFLQIKGVGGEESRRSRRDLPQADQSPAGISMKRPTEASNSSPVERCIK